MISAHTDHACMVSFATWRLPKHPSTLSAVTSGAWHAMATTYPARAKLHMFLDRFSHQKRVSLAPKNLAKKVEVPLEWDNIRHVIL